MKVLDIIAENKTSSGIDPAVEEAFQRFFKNNPHLEIKQKYDPESGIIKQFIDKRKYNAASIEQGLFGKFGKSGVFLMKQLGFWVPLRLRLRGAPRP